MNRKKIKSLVDTLLEQYRLTSIPIDVEKLAELIGAEVRIQNFDDTLSGFAFQKHGIKVIGVNSTEPKDRQRFTIAHEIGHLQLHKGAVSYDPGASVMMFRDSRSNATTDIKEIDANQFAAELLMPEERLRFDIKKIGGVDLFSNNKEPIEELAEKYQVSVRAMSIRLTTLYFS